MRPLLATIFLTVAIASAEQNVVGFDFLETARREFHNGKLDSASNLLADAEKRGQSDGRTLDLRGCILMEQGKLDEASQLFEKAGGMEPLNYARLHSGDAFARQKKWEDARAAYKAALTETNIQTTNERLRFAIFFTYLGSKDEEHAQQALGQITFPTESAAYYYAQSAWAFAHGADRDAKNWLKRANDIFPAKSTAWFARSLYDFGWLKTKPPFASE